MNYKTRRSSGTGAISVTVAPNEPWELCEIRLHLSAGGAATDLTVTVDSANGSKHDTVLYTLAMNGVADVNYRWNPEPIFTNRKDKVVVAYANGGAATWGLEVIYKPLEG